MKYPFLIGTGLVLFDPEGRNEENLGIKNATWAAYTTNFLESLVLFDGVNMQDSLLFEIHISKSFCEDVGKFCLGGNQFVYFD
ncbi:hypothetical protein CFP56_028898 [Quercus suber]|uniref:Uncharacterized protein n=1 Tax=Quercus suber TaxID=58331 RepID=A0AAW0JU72_QUESU